MHNWTRSSSGNTLAVVMIAAVIGSAVMLAMSKIISTSSRALKATEVGGELEMITQTLFKDIDCVATFGATNPNGGTCNSTSAVGGQDTAGTFFRLRRRTLDGSVKYLTGPLVAGVGTLGSWSIRATCSAAEQSLVVRAARPKGAGFEKDFTGQIADWASPRGLLFGGAAGSIPICYGAPSGGAPGMPKRFATFRVGFNVRNNATEFVQVNLTTANPTLQSSSNGSIAGASSTEPFQTTGTISGFVSMITVDVRNPYYNVTATSPINLSFPSPGIVRISLGTRGDIGSGSPPFGTVGAAVFLYQM